jgi:hypothetical protein
MGEWPGDQVELFAELARRLPPIVPFDSINLILHDPAGEAVRGMLRGAVEQDTAESPPRDEVRRADVHS